MDLRFKSPSSFLLGGVSQSGKTTFVLNVLKNIDVLFQNPQCKQNVIFYYNQWQDAYDIFKNTKIVKQWINRLPTTDDIKEKTMLYKDNGGSILIIDDFAEKLDSAIVHLFSVLCHHTNSVVFVLTQNIFSKNRAFRDISLNSTYVVLFKNPRDSSQISNFARQFAPGNTKGLVKAFKKATRFPYSYMLFDFNQTTPTEFRVRSSILPHEAPMRVWVEKED
jgi:hypothetical protein